MSEFGKSTDPEHTGIRHWKRKKPGAQHVSDKETKGMPGRCWCGKDYGHDWPGKNEGAPHPEVET